MLSISNQSFNNFLIVKVHGQMSTSDYEQIFIPAADSIIAEYQAINILIEFCPDFTGWQLSAIWDDLKYSFKHRHEIKRMAIVGDCHWHEWAQLHITPLIKGQLKFFEKGKQDIAFAWLVI